MSEFANVNDINEGVGSMSWGELNSVLNSMPPQSQDI